MAGDVLPLYGAELSDLHVIATAVTDFMQANQAWGSLTVLYVDGVEVTVGTEGGDNDVFRIWWDGESETARIERRVITE